MPAFVVRPRSLRWVSLSATALIAACAGGQSTPRFDPNASAKSQAALFMDVQKKSDIAKLDKLAVTSCNVLYGTETGASASTRPGLGEDRSSRGEVNVSTLYVMQGVDNTQLQALTSSLCETASAKLAAAGYTLVPGSELAAHANYQKMHAAGQATPFTMKQKNGTTYTVFTPAGQSVVDQSFMSTGGAIGNVFKAMGGGGPGVAEAALIDELQTAAVHINILVDFASAKSNDKKGILGNITGQDSAKVDAKVSLAVSGFVSFYPVADLQCFKSLATPCSMPNAPRSPRVIAKLPLESGEPFYSSIADIKSTGSKVGETAYNVFAGLTQLAAAAAGSGSGAGMVHTTQYGVVVDYPAYQAATTRLSDRFMDMAMASVH